MTLWGGNGLLGQRSSVIKRRGLDEKCAINQNVQRRHGDGACAARQNKPFSHESSYSIIAHNTFCIMFCVLPLPVDEKSIKSARPPGWGTEQQHCQQMLDINKDVIGLLEWKETPMTNRPYCESPEFHLRKLRKPDTGTSSFPQGELCRTHSTYKVLTQCWFNAGPAHWSSIRSTSSTLSHSCMGVTYNLQTRKHQFIKTTSSVFNIGIILSVRHIYIHSR